MEVNAFLSGFYRAISQIEERTKVSIDEIVIPDITITGLDKKGIRFYIKDIRSKGCWTIVATSQKIIDQFLGPNPQLKRKYIKSIPSLKNLGVKSCSLEKNPSNRFVFPREIVEVLGKTDITLHWGVGILGGDILEAPKYGVWGIHQGNIRRYRGGPPGFWEYINDEDNITVTLQRYTEELDAGEIVNEGIIDIDDAKTLRQIRYRQCEESIDVLVEGIEKSINGTIETYRPDELGPIYRPSDRDCRITAKYMMKSVKGWIRTLFS